MVQTQFIASLASAEGENRLLKKEDFKPVKKPKQHPLAPFKGELIRKLTIQINKKRMVQTQFIASLASAEGEDRLLKKRILNQ